MTRFTLEPLDHDEHLDRLHQWVTDPRSSFWMMQDATLEDVQAAYAGIAASVHHTAYLGRDRGRPAFLVETYDPARSELADVAELRPGDLGMHILVGPPDRAPEPGYTTAIFRTVMTHCFANPEVSRVVVEPDVRNQAIRDKNVAAGFVEVREIALDGKRAMLSICTREAFDATQETAHLANGAFEEAQRHLVAKAIAEYAHERLIAPAPKGDSYVLETSGSRYEFIAQRHQMEHWTIDERSLKRTVHGAPAPCDAQELVVELSGILGIPDALLPVYLEEIASTLASSAWKRTFARRPVTDLVNAASTDTESSVGYQLIEGAMSEGHPAFVANNGRIGFGIDDYRAYAPEAARAVRLEWVAARREHTELGVVSGESEDDLFAEQLGEQTVARFRSRIEAAGEKPVDYVFVPVHPWQWKNKLTVTFAPDLARRDLIHVGTGDGEYQAQQSIRTFFDRRHPERHYVKTALSIQNMGFVRGLSPAYMHATPAINDWVAGTVRSDPALQSLGFDVLREVAAVGYTGDAFHRLGSSSPYRKMIAGLWRESPIGRLSGSDRLATMASLLHRDHDGRSFVSALINASSVDAASWVRSYLDAYLRPLVHCLFAHDLVFMPHGENVIVVLQDFVPERVIVKDIGEEVVVVSDRPVPDGVERIREALAPDLAALSIHTDVLDGVLRFVAAILDSDGVLPSDEFWAIARAVIVDHVADHPELADAAARYDLLKPRFRHSCLNRLQLRNTLQMVNLAEQADSLLFAGTIANPLAAGG